MVHYIYEKTKNKSKGLYILDWEIIKNMNIKIIVNVIWNVMRSAIIPKRETLSKMVTIPKIPNAFRCIRAVGFLINIIEFICNYIQCKDITLVDTQHDHKGTIAQILSLRLSIEINVMLNKPTILGVPCGSKSAG